MQIFSAGRDGTNKPTEGSTRGPRGPKKKCNFNFSVIVPSNIMVICIPSDVRENTFLFHFSLFLDEI